MTAHIPARPTPTPIPTPAPVEIPPLPLSAFEDPDKVESLVAVADIESELGDGFVVPADREVVVLAVDTVGDENVEVDIVVVDKLVVEDGGSSLLILKYADETSLNAVLP